MNKKKAIAKSDFFIIDGLRGIAAVYVVFNHCRGNLLMGGNDYSKIIPVEHWSVGTKIYYSLLQLTSLGREFVIFFFVLSGFSIAYSLAKNNNIIAFYKRRLLRLYPPYILALLWAAFIFYLVSMLAPNQLKPEMKSVFNNFNFIICNFIYIPKGDLIAQFWSLTHEVIFYILIPFFYFKNLKYYIGLSFILYLVGYLLNVKWVGGSTIYQFLYEYNIFFALGSLLYINFMKIQSFLIVSKHTLWLIVGFAFILMIASKLLLGIDNKISLIISGALSVIMIVNFLHHKIQNSLLNFFGMMSYTIYITHFASIYLFLVFLNRFGFFQYHTNITEWYIWLIGVLICLLMAVPLYYLAEYPTKRVLEKIRK